MGDSEDKKTASDVPEWQKAQSAPEATPETQVPTESSKMSTLEQAKIFLKDPEVQNQTRERKVEFLKTKGIPQSDIDELLKDELPEAQPESQNPKKEDTSVLSASSEMTTLPPLPTSKEDRPPIVTYPEFLTKPVRPPPLMTMNGFLNTLYAFGGVSALIYGTSKYVLEPMVESLTEARISLHDTANQNLAKLVEKLENTVSEIPPTIKKPEPVHGEEGDDASSSYDDPTELFHRDIGVQTSMPSSPRPATATRESLPPSTQQATKLKNLVSSLRAVHDGLNSQTEDIGDIKSQLEAFKDDLDKLSSVSYEFSSGFSYYGSSARNEPDDEIKKAKENIRRVKGVLLSTRSFPGTVR
ncbi:peroxisomal membrane protein PEX14 [Rhypophila sp. PSN 637]